MTTSSAYNYHDDYYSINTGAHRKGGLELDMPALTQHLGLWHPRHAGASGAQRSVIRHGRLVDAYVAAHYAALRELDDFEHNFCFRVGNADVICLFGGAYSAANPLDLEPFDIEAKPEHFALKDAVDSETRILFMKAQWYGLRIVVRCEFHSEYFTITRIVCVTDITAMPPGIGDLEAALSRLARAEMPPKRTMTVDACHAYLYRGFWDRLDRKLFNCAALLRKGAGATDTGRVFADFRGVVMRGDDTGEHGGLSLESHRAEPVGKPYPDEWPVKSLLPAIWPFLTVEKGLDLKRREFTASFMLRKRAVYITALGPQPPAEMGFTCAPLSYLLIARPMSDWQLGTLVDRLHYMGSVRLAALMELPALRRAGANLRETEHEAESAREALDAKWTQKALRHYRRAQDLVAHTDKRKQPIFWEGLQFRVERSRYYIQRFDDFSRFLETSPIEGFQQYDHFVRARLGFNYDYIDRLGRRQDRAVRSIAGIWQSISLDENAQISRAIEKLQTKAEIALLAVIVPHYAIDIIHAFRDEAQNNHQTTFKWYAAILVVGIVLALASLAAYLLDIFKQRDYDRLFTILAKYAILSIVSLGVTFKIMRFHFW